MLPKKYRLPAADIAMVAKKGTKIICHQLLEVKMLQLPMSEVTETETQENVNIAISVSKKLDKRAVVRNKIKRLLRAALIPLLSNNEIAKGKYLIIARSAELANTQPSEISTVLGNIKVSKSPQY